MTTQDCIKGVLIVASSFFAAIQVILSGLSQIVTDLI